jgi:hypothetical protein
MSRVGTTNLLGAGDGSSLGDVPDPAKTGRTDLGGWSTLSDGCSRGEATLLEERP